MIAPDAIDLDNASRIEQGFHIGNIIKCLPLVEPTLDIGECGYGIVRFNHMQSGQFTGCTKTARQALIKELAAIAIARTWKHHRSQTGDRRWYRHPWVSAFNPPARLRRGRSQ